MNRIFITLIIYIQKHLFGGSDRQKSTENKMYFQMYSCKREHCLSSALLFRANPLRDRKCRTQGVACCLNGSVCSWSQSPSLLRGSPLEQANRPKPLFSHHLPCGLNGFRSTLYPWLAADRSGISPLLPMASADEAVLFCFSSCSLGRSKWPARTQLATCPCWLGGWASACSDCMRDQVGLVTASKRKG